MTTLQATVLAPRADVITSEVRRVPRVTSGTSPVPWTPADLTRLLACNALGLFVLLTGWLGASGTGRLSHQLNWTSLAVLGLLLALAGHGAWLLAGRRAVGTRLGALLREDDRTREAMAGAADDQVPLEIVSLTAWSDPEDAKGLVAVPGARRYHLIDCVLVRGKQVATESLAGHEQAGRWPCELCEPQPLEVVTDGITVSLDGTSAEVRS